MTTPATAVTARPAAPAGARPGAAPQAVVLQPFPTGVLDTETVDYDEARLITAAEQQMPNHSFEPQGWTGGFWIQVDATGGVNGGATVAATEDGEWLAIAKLTLKDTGQREVFGPVSGWDILQINTWGGYHAAGDPLGDVARIPMDVGTTPSAGDFSYCLYVPFELVRRDALGTVENKSSSSAWKMELWLGASAAIYATPADTTLPTVQFRITQIGYTEPAAADEHGRPLSQTPPAPGTLQYWSKEDDTLPSGNASYNLENGIGYSIRNLIYYYVATSDGTRATGDGLWPDPVTLTYGKVQLFQRYKTTWISMMSRAFGLTSATADAAGGRANATFPVWFTGDFGLAPGAELRNKYLNTKTGTVLKWRGTTGGAGTLYVLSNYVIPPGNDPAALRAGGR